MSNSNELYAIMQKAASWANDDFMLQACVREFHGLQGSASAIDDAIIAAHRNGIKPHIIDAFEV